MADDLANLSAAELADRVRSDAFAAFRVGVFDIDGVLRGKYMSREKLLSSLEGGFGLCDVVLGWDVQDQPYDTPGFTGWVKGFPDAEVRLLPATARRLPSEPGTLLVLGEFAGPAEAVCPRAALRRVLARAKALGFTVTAGFEFEFFLFAETPQSARDKGHRGLTPLSPGSFGYSVLRNAVHAELCQEILSVCEAMRLPLEGLHTETGPGVLEAALACDEALEAADRAALFKTFAKVLAQRRGLMATFMAKLSPTLAGQSGHIHISLTDAAGRPAFHDPAAPTALPPTLRWFLGGQQRLAPELLALAAPTINSYRRLVPGFWAPTAATWGVENRTAALRVIGGGPKSQRIEYRVSGADIHPHLALAAAIGSGLLGIENRIEPTDPLEPSSYDKPPSPDLRFPQTLDEAARRLQASPAAAELFGRPFVDHYVASRLWEAQQFRRAVTDWELERYFEII